MPSPVPLARRLVQWSGLGAAALLLAGCDVFGPDDCNTGIRPAITIAVVDAVTGSPLAAGAAGFLQDGAYRDSLRITRWDRDDRPTHLGAAFARPGTYSVVIEHVGYARWTATGVRADGGCPRTGGDRVARLVPLP